MSPTLVFPSPFRHHDPPPYGHSDWKSVQPVLLRRSLALSSASALAVALLLSWVLHHEIAAPTKVAPVIEIDNVGLNPVPPPIVPHGGATNVVKTTPTDGIVVPKSPDTPDLPEPPQPANPGPIDPNAKLPIGIGGGDDTSHAALEYPSRPDPGIFVAHDREPKELYTPKPEYPELARAANMEGTVVLKVLVDKEGRVQEVLLVRSSSMFDDAAIGAIRQWRFSPALMGTQPVAAWVTVPVHFVMNGE
jgi:protein TonB